MSTRRARIKAVTALPPRRKNIEKEIPDKNKESHRKTPKQSLDVISENLFPKKTTSPKVIQNEDIIHKAVLSPSIKSPYATNKKPETPKLPTNNAGFRQSPRILSPFLREPTEKRSLFSPPPNLIVRNPNAGKTLEKDVQNKSQTLSEVCKEKDTSKANDVIDQNVPSVPESITDEAMDGIIPLNQVNSGPKPIDLWKNEIISENAEVLFDPIVPLPSPSKVRPKVRPVPRLVPLRRNSIQGSASESEDESRRLLGGGSTPARQRHDSQTSHSTTHTFINREVNRVRNNSFSSSVSQQASHAPPPPASPLKEKHISNRRRAEQARRLALRRRRSARPETLTMYDLIFYNPTANPILPDQEEMKAKEADAKDAEAQKVSETEADEPETPQDGEAPVPQIKLGPNGEIILDEQSLVIKQSGSNRKVSNSVVREGAWSGGGGRYSRSARTADWSPEETVRFYRALAAVGTDFSLMTPLFPNRIRRDLKLKFKKEERQNAAQVDKALRSASSWDIARLEEEFREEREEAARQAQKEKERLQKWKESEKVARTAGGRISKGARAVQAIVQSNGSRLNTLSADQIILRAKQIAHNTRRKQKKPQKHETNETNSDASNNQPNTEINKVPISIMLPDVPANIEEGSLVVLTVNDPSSPSKKMLQTYISRGPGNLTPVALPPQLLNSVVNYMKKGGSTPQSLRSNTSSPVVNSPASVAGSWIEPSPKRIRRNSFTITQSGCPISNLSKSSEEPENDFATLSAFRVTEL